MRLAFSSGSCFLASGDVGAEDPALDAGREPVFSAWLLSSLSAGGGCSIKRWCASSWPLVSVRLCAQGQRRRPYFLLIAAQVLSPLLYVVLDAMLELLPSQLDAAGQGIQLLPREAWDLGQARISLKVHGLCCYVAYENRRNAVTGTSQPELRLKLW